MSETEGSDRVGKDDSYKLKELPDDGSSKPKDTSSEKQGATSCDADVSSKKEAAGVGDEKNGSINLPVATVSTRPKSPNGKRDVKDDDGPPRSEKSSYHEAQTPERSSHVEPSSTASVPASTSAPPTAPSLSQSLSQLSSSQSTTSDVSKPKMKVFGSGVLWNPNVTALTSRLIESDGGSGAAEMERLTITASPKLSAVPVNERKRTAPDNEDTKDDRDHPSSLDREDTRDDSSVPASRDVEQIIKAQDPSAPPPKKQHMENKDEEEDLISSPGANFLSSSSTVPEPFTEITTGEEDEIMVFKAKSKLFQIVDQDWKERGVGDLKLNVHTEDSSRARLLLRTEGTQRLVLNSPLVNGMMNKLEGKWLRFHVFTSDAKPDVYAARMDSPQTAKSMHDSIKAQLER